MFEKLKAHYRLWTKWARRNQNDILYKILVLFKAVRSATFEMMPQIEEFENNLESWTVAPFKEKA